MEKSARLVLPQAKINKKQNQFVPTKEDSEEGAIRTLNLPRQHTSNIDLVDGTIEEHYK